MMIRALARRAGAPLLCALLAAGTARALDAQAPAPVSRDSTALSLEDAVSRAISGSDEIRLARSQVELASTQVRSARSGAFPQLSAQLGYTRTFASAFSGGGSSISIPDSLRFSPDSTLSIAERVKYLEKHVPSAGLASLGSLFGNLPFGQANAYTATLSGSQALYSGGRLGAAGKIATEYLESARLTLNEQAADIELQVRSAYFRARLAQELASISGAAVAQAERFLATERVRLSSGLGSELDVLRAEVALANLQPQQISATNAADVAMLDLKRLINIPLAQPLRLVTTLDVPTMLATADSTGSLETLSRRASIAAEERQVRIRQQQVSIARSAYLPSVSLVFNYGKLLYPTGVFSFNQDWRTDFTAGLTVNVPIFNGNRTAAEVAQAQVALNQEQLRLSQLRENVQIEYERARGERERARSSIEARQRTVQQAQRVYDLTVLRYDQGLASQLEVSESRLSLLQARSNLAQAVADYQIANATLSRALGATSLPR
ncbi:MAG: outer rane efflux protein [Gemmatimonadetes bacterium]|nr:outer rane efflux protein [Gemmatimonadota bacterium]